jgi:alpha-tubulin suppressor-like RCC1 family protein
VPEGLQGVIAIAAGAYHSLALKQDGTIVAWGYYGSGQAIAPSAPEGSGLVAIAARGTVNLAVGEDGTVTGWGLTPAPEGLSNVVAVAAGYYHGLALQEDGTVTGWGSNIGAEGTYCGQAAVLAGLGRVIAVAAGDYHSLVLEQGGTVVAWGDSTYGQCAVPGGLNGVVAIAGGGDFSLALEEDGTVVEWGGGGSPPTVPWDVSAITAMAAGSDHCLALDQSGTVLAWGDNTYGQCTVPSGMGRVVSIAAGSDHSLALRQDGTVVAWGGNDYGQATVPSGLTGVFAIAAGCESSVALITYQPLITAAPSSQTVKVGLAAQFGVNAIAAAPLSYQWYFNGTNALAGATEPALQLTNVQFSQAGAYAVVVTNQYGAVTSLVASLAILPYPPAIQTQPAGCTVPWGGEAAFSVVAAGYPPLAYQWYFNGTQGLAGATSPALQFANAQPSQAGAYTVVVTNVFGAVTSSPAALVVVTPGTVPVPTETALRLAMASGGRVLFSCDGTIPVSTIAVATNTVLDGAGHQVTISGGSSNRVFYVPPGVSLTLSSLTIADGLSQDGQGGGVLNDGSLEVAACIFRGNEVLGQPGTNNYGAAGGPANGGAICNSGAGALSVSASTFWSNTVTGGPGTAGQPGSFFPIWTGSLDGGGGGIGGTGGGAIYNAGTARILNSTFTANFASGGQGGAGGDGGYWIYETDRGPQASYGANGPAGPAGSAIAAVYDASGGCALTNCTLVSNLANTNPSSACLCLEGPALVNTLLAGNNGTNSFTDSGHNLLSATTVGVVGPLADNGGPTLTMALLPGSPAIDAADTASAPPTDQRGVPRPVGPAADIGAFEYQPPWPPTLWASLSSQGGLDLQVLGPAGRSFRLLASATLTNWVPVATNQIGPGDILSLRLDTTGDSHCFYQLVSP